MFEKKFVEATVVENRRWTDTLHSLKIDAPIEGFTPGQFGRLALEIDGKKVARPYSFVNGPAEPYHEFYSILVPGGLLSTRLHGLQAHDRLWIASSASGFFTLDEVRGDGDLWMLSTGTALGPFLSILKTDEPWDRFKRLVLVHAVRYKKELSYADTIAGFAKRDPKKFTMIRFVSREDTDFAIKGRIPAAIESGVLQGKAQLEFNSESSQVMLCGNPGMVKDTSEVLKQRGLTKNRRREPGNITTENYW